MTKTELEDVVIGLLVIVKRNVTGWERGFSDSEVKEMRKIWNQNLSESSPNYW